MARSETAQAGVLGSVRSMFLLVVSVSRGPIWSSTMGLGRGVCLFGRGVDRGSGILLFFPAPCADVSLEGGSVLPPCVPRNLQLF